MDQQPGVACQRRFCVLIATSLKRQKGEAAVKYVIVITGASSGFGALTARRLAEAGHTVYATMRETGGRNAKQVEAARKFAAEKNVDLRTAELDVSSQESADRAVQQVLGAAGRLDTTLMEPSYGGLSRKVPVSLHGASIVRIDDGKITDWSDYYDGLTSRRTALASYFTEWVEL